MDNPDIMLAYETKQIKIKQNKTKHTDPAAEKVKMETSLYSCTFCFNAFCTKPFHMSEKENAYFKQLGRCP